MTPKVVSGMLFLQDLFRPSYAFFFIHLAHIIAFEVLGYLVMKQFGTGWIPYLITLLCCTIVQVRYCCCFPSMFIDVFFTLSHSK